MILCLSSIQTLTQTKEVHGEQYLQLHKHLTNKPGRHKYLTMQPHNAFTTHQQINDSKTASKSATGLSCLADAVDLCAISDVHLCLCDIYALIFFCVIHKSAPLL